MAYRKAHKTGFNVEGFDKLNRQLQELSLRQAKSVMRKSMYQSLSPTVERAKSLVPKDTQELKGGIAASIKLSPRQRRRLRGQDTFQAYVGIDQNTEHGTVGHLVEFGTRSHRNRGLFKYTVHPGTKAQPFLRPAWEGTRDKVLRKLRVMLWINIKKRIRLNARAAARKASQ